MSKRTILLVPFLCLCLATAARARQKKLKLATLAPKGTSYYKLLLELKQQWRRAPGGGVRLVIYPDGQMGGEADMVRRMRVGQIQVALMTASGLAEIDQSVAALQNLPMMFRDLAEAKFVRARLRPMILRKFRQRGFVILSLEDAGWVRFFTRTRAADPEAFKRLKIYALAGDAKAIQIWKSAGYHPVPLDTTAMLTGLKTGMVDVVPMPPTYALAQQIYRPAPFMLDLNWAPLIGGLIITGKAWDALKPDQRKAMQAAAAEVGRKLMQHSRKENSEAVAAMRERGLQVIGLTPAQRDKWRAAVSQAYPTIRGGIVSADLFDRVKDLLAEYRKRKPVAGNR